MRDNERGSTLISVLAAVLIMAVMMSALVTTSLTGTRNTQRMVDASKALSNARSGIEVVYNKMVSLWGTMNRSPYSDLSPAIRDMNNFAASIQSTSFPGPFQVHITQGDENLLNDPNSTAGSLYIDFIITVTGWGDARHSTSETLMDKVVLSGAIDALNYAVYTPGNLFIAGDPEIDGKIGVGGSLYLDSNAWVGTPIGQYGKPYRTFVVNQGESTEFSRIPENHDTQIYEPADLPLVHGGTLGVANRAFTFSKFNDQAIYGGNSTLEFGDASQVYNPTPLLSPEQISGHFRGGVPVTQFQNLLDPNYVEESVDAMYDTMQHMKLKEYPVEKLGPTLPVDGGKVNNSVDVTTSVTTNGPIYIDGDLTIGTYGASTEPTIVVNKPIYVTGNLYLYGKLYGNGVIYVGKDPSGNGNVHGGQVTINNVPSSDDNSSQNVTLEIYALDNISLTFETNSMIGMPTSPTVFNAFLATNANMYVGGATAFNVIKGGIAARNLIITGVEGTRQTLYSNVIETSDPSETTRRLKIQYDDKYIQTPLQGTPSTGAIQIQALQQPYQLSP